MSLTAQLGYLGLEVSNLGAWRRFATEALGLEIGAPRADGAIPLRMDGHAHRFLLQEGPRDDMAFLGWEVPDAASLAAVRARLGAARVEHRAGSAEERAARGVADLIVFEDPNGIHSEVYHTPSMGKGEFRSAKAASGFLTGDMGMGHVFVYARDSARCEQFYREILGFRLTDYVDFARDGHSFHGVFLHVNPRHHSLAFAEANAKKRLNHFMLEVNELDDVGAALYRCQDLGVPLARSLGRHPNDRMVSFYGVTPSGFNFEIGWGGRQVDDRDWEVQTYHDASVWGHRSSMPMPAVPASA
jgi:2,3-dihydroxybiphenyl 1,2-dioxygenase